MLLRADSLTRSFGPKRVIRSATLRLDKRDRAGLVGTNGAGKTTLLRILMGQLAPDTGEIQLRTERIGYLPQFLDVDPGAKVRDIIGMPYGKTAGLASRMAYIEEEMARGAKGTDWEGLAGEYSLLQEEFSRIGGHESAARGRSALTSVGLDGDVFERRLDTLSGGELTKVMLARVVMQTEEADLLFLDEPTNHLDTDTVEWLEEYLLKFKGAVLVVSHDRYFLDNICNTILEIRDGVLKRFNGNYTRYAEKRAAEDLRLRRESERAAAEKDRHRRIADELHRRNPFSSVHKTRMRMAERVEDVSAPPDDPSMTMIIGSAGKSGRNFIIAEGLTVKRGERTIVRDAYLDLEAGDKLGLFGPNGAGKSTLLKVLLGRLEHKGTLWVAPGTRCGYFSQSHDGLSNGLSAEEHLLGVLGRNEKLSARKLLAALLLRGKDVERPVSELSGGERTRVALAVLMAEPNNLLILDEPTNYLDIPSRHAVEEALSSYGGTVLLVTHDRYLLDRVCNKVAELKGGRLTVFSGNYSQMKGHAPRERIPVETNVFRVVSSFTDWTTRTKFKAGQRITIAEDDMERFEWALGTGKLKRVGAGERKIVRR